MRFSGTCRSGIAGVLFFLGLPIGAAWGASGGITVMPDASVLIQIANFIFLIVALNMLVYKPIRGILAKRKEKIDGLEESIVGLSDDARQKEDDYAAGIREARAKGLEQKSALIQDAENEEKQIVEKINQNASEELAEIRSKIGQDIEDVRASLMKDVESFADAIGQKILGRSV